MSQLKFRVGAGLDSPVSGGLWGSGSKAPSREARGLGAKPALGDFFVIFQ